MPALPNCGCPDPSSLTYGAHLSVLDGQFCYKRLENNPGVLVNQQTASGAYQQVWSTAPVMALQTFQLTQGQTFGNLTGVLANGQLRQLLGPASANLVLMTDAAGNFYPTTLPGATIPDPLTVTTLNATNLNATVFTLSGTMSASGLASGTIVNQLGLDGSGNVVKASNSTGIQTAMFYEAPTSPSATYPNKGVVAGSNLVIGNRLSDSGGNIVEVVDSQTLKVLVAGPYRVDWGGEIVFNGLRRGPGLGLSINGVLVNPGNSSSENTGDTNQQRWMNCAGFEYRPLAVNDIIRIQVASGSGTDIDAYSVRVGFMKTG